MTALAVHVLAGALAILFGFIALYVVKGERVHRTSGMIFVYAMITMALMGATMALVFNVAPAANAPVGLLTAYLVVTGFTTVRPPSSGSRQIDLGLMLVASVVALALFTFGIQAATSLTGKMYGMPSFPFFIFGTVALLAIIGDARMMRSGGVQAIRGAPRLARHLWRMSFALLIATFSFFIGQAKIIPKPYRIFPLLMIPPLMVLAALLYWLWRVRFRRSLRGIVTRASSQTQHVRHERGLPADVRFTI